MRALSRAIVASLLALGTAAHAAAPNIVIILADDMGWNDVGYHGSEIRTPHLDQLAAGGATLSQFHSQPTCSPTRTALMTGYSPQRLGVYRQFAKNSTEGLPRDVPTMAERLREAGYQTFLTGKWHLGHSRKAFLPNARGFDHFYGHVTGGIGYWDHVHGGGLDWQRNGETLREEGYATHLLAAEAIRLIESRDRDRPFLLYASFNAPHLPNEAPQASIDAYQHIENPFRRKHAAMVTELDSAIGELVATLRREGLTDNTLIWFMSDNGGLNASYQSGPMYALAQRLDRWFEAPVPGRFLEFVRTNLLEGGADNQPLREGKGSIYEGGARVPSLVSWPGRIQPNAIDAFITVQDVLPSVLTAAGIATDASLDGKSRWPSILGQTDSPPADYVTRGQFGDQAYYQWPWKLVDLQGDRELYNLEQDPLEAMDLAVQHPQKVAALAALLADLPRGEDLHIPTYKVVLDPDFFGGEEDRPPWADVVAP